MVVPALRTWKESSWPLCSSTAIVHSQRQEGAMLCYQSNSEAQLPTPALHPLAPPTHASLKWLHVSCVHALWKKKKKKETIPSFYFLSSYVYFPHDRIARCKYKDRITTNACHMKVVLVYKNHIDYLKYVFERFYDYLLNFCAFKYHL